MAGWMLLMMPALVILNSKFISLSVRDRITDRVQSLPGFPFALVLGAGNTTDPVSRNYSFASRMDKTAELYRNGKIKKIIVSGISNKPFYNEPNDMKSELVKMGIPAVVIYPDHGGDRTFHSLQRARDHLGAGTLIIISQRMQLERALFLAGRMNLNAFGLEAAPHPAPPDSRDRLRELLARLRCWYDWLIND